MNEVELTKIFKALGNQRRVKIVKLLKVENELSVGQIARRIRLSGKSTSKHLTILLNVGFLQNEGKQGSVFYSLNPDLSGFISLIVKNLS